MSISLTPLFLNQSLKKPFRIVSGNGRLFFSFLLFMLPVIVFGQSPYCNPGYTNGCSNGDNLRDVFLSNYSNTGTGCSSNQYKLNTADTIQLQRGVSYSLTVASGGGKKNSIGAWIDYSQNNGFGQFGEFIGSVNPAGGTQQTIVFTIPISARLGETRLRIRTRRSANGVPSAGQSCSTFTYGEAEDYIVKLNLAPSCNTPTNLMASNITFNSADIDWTSNDNGTQWEVAYGKTGFTLGTGTRVLTSKRPTTLSNLKPDTKYDVYVREICQSGNTSSFSFSKTFETNCKPFGTKFKEDFESTSSGWVPGLQGNGNNKGNTINECWSRIPDPVDSNNYQVSHWGTQSDGTPGFNSGPSVDHTKGTKSGQFIYTNFVGFFGNTTDTVYLKTPLIDLTSLNDPIAGFWYHMNVGTSVSLELQVSNDFGKSWNTESTIIGQQQTSASAPWIEQTTSLSSYKNDTIKLRFVGAKSGSTFGGTDIAIDDVVVKEKPSCSKPTNVRDTLVKTDSADIKWDPVKQSNSWQIAYGKEGFILGKGTRISTNSSQPYSLSGLSSNTTYDVYVREICGKDTSAFAGPITFRTKCGSYTAPFKETFDKVQGQNIPFCWARAGNVSNLDFDIQIDGGSFSTNAPPSPPNKVTFEDNNLRNGDTAILVSPEFSDLTNYNQNVEFKVAFEDGDIRNHKLYVGVMKNQSDISSFRIVDSITSSRDGIFRSVTVPLTNGGLIGNRDHVALASGIDGGFDELSIDDFFYGTCNFPTSLSVLSVDTNSIEVEWTTPGGGNTWQVAYGKRGFQLGNGTRKLAIDTSYKITGLSGNIEGYDIYVREICGAGDTSNFVGPVNTTTTCGSNLPALTLPYDEGFEVFPGFTYKDSAQFCNVKKANWKFRGADKDCRLRFTAPNATAKSGSKAATLDYDGFGSFFNDTKNDWIVTLNLSSYAIKDSVVLTFQNRQYNEDNSSNDNVWIRGSRTNSWVKVYDLFANQPSGASYDSVNIQVSRALGNAGQSFSSTFQIRFGQEGGGGIGGGFGASGRSFDNISLVRSKDLSISKIVNPVQKCGLTANEPVTVAIKNVSARAIAPTNFDINYDFNGRTETKNVNLNQSLSPGDTIVRTYNKTVGLALQGATFNLTTWVNFKSDYNANNDTLSKQITVPTLPGIPSVREDTICKDSSATLIASGGGADDYIWYTDSVGGKQIVIDDTLNVQQVDQDTTFYVSSITYPDSCESNRVAADVILNNPAPPSTVGDTVCQGDTAMLTAKGGGASDFSWFSDSTGGQRLSTNDTLMVEAFNDTTYYAVGITNQLGCKSPRSPTGIKISRPLNLRVTNIGSQTADARWSSYFPDSSKVVKWTKKGVGFGQADSGFVTQGNKFKVRGLNSKTTYDVYAAEAFCADGVIDDYAGPVRFTTDSIANDLSVSGITEPNQACGLTNSETVTIQFQNQGLDTFKASTSFNISWQLNNGPIKTENVTLNQALAPAKTTTKAFDSTVDLSKEGTNNTLQAWIDWTGDKRPGNDSTQKTIYVPEVPAKPTAANDTVCRGDSATLVASGNTSQFEWYTDSVGGKLLAKSDTLRVAPGSDTTYYVTGFNNPDSCKSPRVAAKVVVNPVPKVKFASDSACTKANIDFTSNTTLGSGTISSYAWDFGDGTTAKGASVQHSYASSGNYTVQLKVTSDKGCADSLSKNAKAFPLPQVGFASDSACTNDTLNFTSSATLNQGSITNYKWNFGNGDTDQGANVKQVYSTAGNYSVDHIVTSNQGCKDTASKNARAYPLPVADFASDSVCTGDTIKFSSNSSLSQGSITKYDWQLGNGTTATGPSASTVYANSGNYSVQLITKTGQGCRDTVSKNAEAFPIPSVDFSSDSACLNESLEFSSNASISSGSVKNYSWNYGDGTTASGKQVKHTYKNSGSYSVEHVATSNEGCRDTLNKNAEAFPLPQVNFTSDSACLGEGVSFNSNSSISSGTIDSFIWMFGDGAQATGKNVNHTYSSVGSYNVEHVVTSAKGCQDTTIKNAEAFPFPTADFTSDSACVNQSASFASTSSISSGTISSYSWDFDDGSTATGASVSNAYSSSGNYDVELIATSDEGCKDTATKNAEAYPLPTADFTSDSACAGNPLNFSSKSAISQGSIIDYEWDFGDGNTASGQSVSYAYASSGSFTVAHIVTSNNGCLDSATRNAESAPFPVAGFISDSACLGSTLNFSSNSNLNRGTIKNFQWNFGDGSTASGSNVSHSYDSAGSYGVRLIVTSGEGCADTLTQNAEVYPVPNADFVADSACNGEELRFSARASLSDGAITAYNWNYGDGINDSTQDVTHTYQDTGTYTVSLITKSNRGCSDTISKKALVQAIPSPDFSIAEPCEGDTTLIQNQTDFAGNPANLSYRWDFGIGNTSTKVNPAKVFDSSGLFQVSLEVATTKLGCSDTVISNVRVYPKASAGFSTSQAGPGEIRFTPENDTASEYQWEFGDGVNSKDTVTTHAYDSNGSYNVTLTTITGKGCTNTNSQTIVIETVGLFDGVTLNQFDVYPNPVAIGDELKINYSLGAGANVNLGIYNMKGKRIKRLHEGHQLSGDYQYDFKPKSASNGIYLIRLVVDGEVSVKKIMLNK